MITLPDPLHPAIVHFPIALLIIGSLVAIGAVFTTKLNIRFWCAMILAAGALGAAAATWSGEEDEEKIEGISAAMNETLEEHEEWGERARNLGILSAVFAIAALVTTPKSLKVSRALTVITAVVSITASYAVMEAGHYGGELVYKHGAGMKTESVEESD